LGNHPKIGAYSVDNFDLGKVVITFVVFLFSTSCHEAAHAAMAYWWGDPTGKEAGQLTLNPIPHIKREPWGMVAIPLFMLLQSGGGMLMGWASTPVNASRMRNARWGDFWTSAAGPLTNLLIAIICIVLSKVVVSPIGAVLGGFQEATAQFLWTGVWLNIVLTVLNFLPIPPLDGGHMMSNLLPYEAAQIYNQIRPFGYIILIGIMMTGVFGSIVRPIISWANHIIG
jgi:Zn-dependent protease